MRIKLEYILVCVITIVSSIAYAQKDTSTVKKIRILHADKLQAKRELPGAQILTGNTQFEHNGALMNCDSALFYLDSNSLYAFGNIKVNQGDSVTLTGDSLFYSGNTKIARLNGNITFRDNQLTLTTTELTYNLDEGIGQYTKGATIVSTESKNTLISKIGTYRTNTKTFFFKDSVELFNDEYTMKSDTLVYHHPSEVSNFHGPTTIESKENFIYCENGWYDSQNEISSFWKDAYIKSKEQTLTGDSIYYDRTKGYGQAFGNVVITDTVNKVKIYGDEAYHNENTDSSMITKKALFEQYFEKDTLYLSADTLTIVIDSATTKQLFRGYHNVQLIKPDIQAICDSLVYNEIDSLMTLFKSPIIWSDENQLSADSIWLHTNKGEISKIKLKEHSFIVSQVDTVGFNQIKGKLITGHFKDNQLKRINVEGNGETIYLLGEEKQPPTDINHSYCSSMIIDLDSSEISTIRFLNEPNATMSAIVTVPKDELTLKGFKWEENKRPLFHEELISDKHLIKE